MDLTKEILEVLNKYKSCVNRRRDGLFEEDFKELSTELNDLFALHAVSRS